MKPLKVWLWGWGAGWGLVAVVRSIFDSDVVSVGFSLAIAFLGFVASATVPDK